MLQKVGKKISMSRQISAKHLVDLKKRHTEGELSELSDLHSSRKGRKRITSSTTSSSDLESRLPSPPL